MTTITLQELLLRIQRKLVRKQLRASDHRAHSLHSVCLLANTTERHWKKVAEGAVKRNGEKHSLTMEQIEVLCSLMGYEIKIIES